MRIAIANGVTKGLAEGIIDNTHDFLLPMFNSYRNEFFERMATKDGKRSGRSQSDLLGKTGVLGWTMAVQLEIR